MKRRHFLYGVATILLVGCELGPDRIEFSGRATVRKILEDTGRFVIREHVGEYRRGLVVDTKDGDHLPFYKDGGRQYIIKVNGKFLEYAIDQVEVNGNVTIEVVAVDYDRAAVSYDPREHGDPRLDG